MKKSSVMLSLLLIVVSSAIYVLQVTIFHTAHDTAFYFLQDMAFLPLQVAIVTIVLSQILDYWNKRDRLKKINMAISAFFSEAGTEIMVEMSELNHTKDTICSELQIGIGWSNADFGRANKVLKNAELNLGGQTNELEALKALLSKKRDFMLRMLENPNLLEHDTFTDMLLAIFHVTEELLARGELSNLPSTDVAHLTNDMSRALRTLLIQWLGHMEHLHTEYPYLYSLEVRRNPFNNGNVIIRE